MDTLLITPWETPKDTLKPFKGNHKVIVLYQGAPSIQQDLLRKAEGRVLDNKMDFVNT